MPVRTHLTQSQPPQPLLDLCLHACAITQACCRCWRACRHTTEEAPGSQHSRPLEEMFAVLEAALNLRHQLQPPTVDPSHQDRRVSPPAEHDQHMLQAYRPSYV